VIRGTYKIAEAGGLGYLMSCYTKHPDGLDVAAEDVGEWAAHLMASGIMTYAPIVYGHKLASYLPRTKMPQQDMYSHELWMNHCEKMWMGCDYGIVLMNKGWGASEGIAIEISELTMAEKNVYFLDKAQGKILRLAEVMAEAETDQMHGFNDFVQTAARIEKAKHIEGYNKYAVEALKGRISNAYNVAQQQANMKEPRVKRFLGKTLQ
jgi:Domain of unknown function (DUF1937)